jgi:hypothetical protein
MRVHLLEDFYCIYTVVRLIRCGVQPLQHRNEDLSTDSIWVPRSVCARPQEKHGLSSTTRIVRCGSVSSLAVGVCSERGGAEGVGLSLAVALGAGGGKAEVGVVSPTMTLGTSASGVDGLGSSTEVGEVGLVGLSLAVALGIDVSGADIM